VFLKPFKATINGVYCRQVLDPHDIIDCTPKRKVFLGEANIAQTTTLPQVNAPQEAIMSGDANVSNQTPTVPGLKAPPEVNISQKEISANMNPPNIHGEPPVHDEVMNLQEKPDDGKEMGLSSMSIFGKNNNNGLLFAPTCTTCFHENKYLLPSKKSFHTNRLMSALTALESALFFPQGCIIVDTTIRNPTKFSSKRNYSVPQPMTPMSYDYLNP
jgi:hypothetical protein